MPTPIETLKSRSKRARWAELGRCTGCGRVRDRPGLARCQRCAAQQRAAAQGRASAPCDPSGRVLGHPGADREEPLRLPSRIAHSVDVTDNYFKVTDAPPRQHVNACVPFDSHSDTSIQSAYAYALEVARAFDEQMPLSSRTPRRIVVYRDLARWPIVAVRPEVLGGKLVGASTPSFV